MSYKENLLKKIEIDQLANRVIDTFVRHGGLPAPKEMMRMIGFDCGHCRRPLGRLTSDEVAALRMLEDVAAYAAELRREQGLNFSVRIGINSGEVVAGGIGPGGENLVRYACVMNGLKDAAERPRTVVGRVRAANHVRRVEQQRVDERGGGAGAALGEDPGALDQRQHALAADAA